MAPKNTPGLNIGDTDQLLNLMGFQRPKTASEIMQLYNQGLAGKGPLKDKFISPIIKGKIEAEAMGLNFLPKTNSLDSAFFE